MKLAWFTPFSRRSAIGRFSAGVVSELAKTAEVVIHCFDADDLHSSSVPVRTHVAAADVSEREMGRCDLAVFNFGNYLPYHREIYAMSRRWPGISILHDFVMRDFFQAYYENHLKNPRAFELLLEKLYGDQKAEREADDHFPPYPCFEEAARGSLGVVTHSAFFERQVRQKYPGPVQRLSMPYPGVSGSPAWPRDRLNIPPGHKLILTVGDVNPNKQILAALAALGEASRAGHKFVYVIAGHCTESERRKVEASLKRHQISDSVRLLGHIPDDLLQSYLTYADLCINLRDPVTEGASASAIEEMSYGKAVVVNNVGFFSELPDDAACKVNLRQGSDLATAICGLLQDSSRATALGERARKYAEKEFRADRYAQQFLDFAWQVRSAQPLLRLSDRLARECNRMGVVTDMPILDALAREMTQTFCRYPVSLPLWRE